MTRFTWDERKNRANRRKHGVSFETAALVFDDRFVIFEQDREVDGEARWQAIGKVLSRFSCWWHMPMKKTMKQKQSGSSPREASRRASEKRTTRNSSRTMTLDELKSDATAQARAQRELARLAKGGPVDLSDAPELPAPAWEKPIRGMEAWLETVHSSGMYKPVKQAVSMRLDADVVAWLKQSGPGYQTRANRILREKMMRELASSSESTFTPR